MTKRDNIAATLAFASAITAAGSAYAEDVSQEEVDALRARIEALESARNGPSGDLGDFQLGNTKFDLYGYVKADFFYDFEFDQGDTQFVNVIGEPSAATSGTFGATARQTRIGLLTETPTDIGDVVGQIELDLFGGSSAAGELRIRHANVRIGDAWIIGQYWTNFMPIGQYPTSVEFNGPVGITFARVPQVRYSGKVGQNLDYSFSIEENVSGSNSRDPVFTAATQYSTDLYSARIAGLWGTARTGTGNGNSEVDQYGVTVSGSVRPWANGLFQATYVNGQALGPWMIGVGDAIVNGEANDVYGFTVEYRHDLTDKLNVGVAYGREDYDLATSTGTLAFTELETVHVNAFYKATDKLTLSAEYAYGERNDASSGDTFDGNRVQFAAQLDF